MHHEATLIATVAIAFVLAFGFGFIADRLGLPALVGYLFAGIAVGPFTPGFVADAALAPQLAEMGVILLMFGVGLHFSASDLLAVKGIALPGAIGQIVLATLLGVGLASLWGWGLGAGVVFGLSLSVASTVVLLKALEERNLVDTPDGRVAIGWLIVEDLAMVLALVMLPAFATALGGHPVGADAAHAPATAASGAGGIALTVALTLGKVAAFVVIAALIGPKLVPYLLAQVARTGSRELFTLAVLAIALGIAYGSSEIFGVSFALGAFVAGVVLSESQFSHKAAAESMPLKDAFSVLFFVSVGMIFDPSILLREPLAVLAVLGLIVVGKTLIAFLIVLALRYPVSTALTVSVSLAQIGEFSFILVGLGMSLGLLPAEGRDLVLAGALLSITLNPLTFALAARLRKSWESHGAHAYGQHNFAVLEQDLARARQRVQERECARMLEVQSLLETFPVLSVVDEHDQEELLLLFKPVSADPGERVIRTGDKADGAYFISSGSVEVLAAGRNITLEPGAFFGEMALLDGTRRGADVTALDYCQFFFLDRRDFTKFTQRHPEVLSALASMASERREMNRQSAA